MSNVLDKVGNAAAGIFKVEGKGRKQAAAGAVTITPLGGVACRYFQFWLDPGSSVVHVDEDGTAGAGEPAYDDSMGPVTLKLATPATSIVVYFDGAAGYLNWKAGN